MASDDKKNPFHLNEDDDDSGTSGSDGRGGKIEFVDFLDTNTTKRDDLLPAAEQKHLIGVHKEVHEQKVKQQKEQIEQYKQLKNGKVSLEAHRAGKGAGAASGFKNNPALKNYGSGIDPKVIGLPNENTAETNAEKREELLNELRYQLGYQPAPKFNPKPSGL
jgi:hypothetical protein